jgi:colicin import membrane protein
MMRKINMAMQGILAASALFVAIPTAFAGDEERALAAIAQAQGKIDAALRIKGGGASPEVIAKAQASLRLAKEEYQSGKEQKAIQSAVEAQQFADTAIGEANQSADLNAQAQNEAVAAAQQDAVNANARADAADQKAAAATSVAARAAAMPATTTVTTETVKSAPASRTGAKKVVRTTTAPARTTAEQTTTTVTTQP